MCVQMSKGCAEEEDPTNCSLQFRRQRPTELGRQRLLERICIRSRTQHLAS